MSGFLDLEALLAWCLDHIECDACGAEGAFFNPPTNSFLCRSDLRLIRMLAKRDELPFEQPPE